MGFWEWELQYSLCTNTVVFLEQCFSTWACSTLGWCLSLSGMHALRPVFFTATCVCGTGKPDISIMEMHDANTGGAIRAAPAFRSTPASWPALPSAHCHKYRILMWKRRWTANSNVKGGCGFWYERIRGGGDLGFACNVTDGFGYEGEPHYRRECLEIYYTFKGCRDYKKVEKHYSRRNFVIVQTSVSKGQRIRWSWCCY